MLWRVIPEHTTLTGAGDVAVASKRRRATVTFGYRSFIALFTDNAATLCLSQTVNIYSLFTIVLYES